MSENISPLILVVDDNPLNLQILGNLLKKNDYRVAAAQDGYQALSYVEKKHPDLILLDVMMPGIDGFEVCGLLKKDPETRDIPILFLTALTEADNKLKGFTVGGADYVTKPFSHKEVLARVRVFIENKLAQTKLQEKNLVLAKALAEKNGLGSNFGQFGYGKA